MSTMKELLSYLVVTHKIFTCDEIHTSANSDKIWKEFDHRIMFVCLAFCLFVCLFVCLFACLFAYLFVCPFVHLFI